MASFIYAHAHPQGDYSGQALTLSLPGHSKKQTQKPTIKIKITEAFHIKRARGAPGWLSE